MIWSSKTARICLPHLGHVLTAQYTAGYSHKLSRRDLVRVQLVLQERPPQFSLRGATLRVCCQSGNGLFDDIVMSVTMRSTMMCGWCFFAWKSSVSAFWRGRASGVGARLTTLAISRICLRNSGW